MKWESPAEVSAHLAVWTSIRERNERVPTKTHWLLQLHLRRLMTANASHCPCPERNTPLDTNAHSQQNGTHGNFKLLSFNVRADFNRPFPNYLQPLLQSESWCSSFHMKMSLICMLMKSHFHMKGWAPRLALKKRLKVIRKWPIVCRKTKTNYAAIRLLSQSQTVVIRLIAVDTQLKTTLHGLTN